MTVTGKLLSLYHVDCQLSGLSSRLRVAERFLAEQTRRLEELERSREGLGREIKRLKATAANQENEIAVIDGRINAARDRMNSANTNKEYKALLLEVNMLRDSKSEQETEALAVLERIEKLSQEEAELAGKIEAQRKVVEVARTARDAKEAEIRDRLEELRARRADVAREVPPDALSAYGVLFDQRGEEAMAPLQELDRKRHEFSCGACMMAIPLDLVTALMSHGNMTRCVSCGVILYLDEKLAEAIQPRKR